MSNYPPNQLSSQGQFIQQTPLFDVQLLAEADLASPEFRQLLVQLAQQTNNISIAVNSKSNSSYLNQIWRTGNNWFNKKGTKDYTNNQLNLRPEFMMIVDFGALPNAGTKSVAHGIPISDSTVAGVNPYHFVYIGGAASKPDTAGIGLSYIPIPYSSATLNNNIELFVDATNVTIVTAIDYSAYTDTTIELRFLKS